MSGPWRVIVERRGAPREVILTTPSHQRALAVAKGVPRIPGTRVYLQRSDSADQLQVTKTGRVIRDQPHVASIGEAVVINVPTATIAVQAEKP